MLVLQARNIDSAVQLGRDRMGVSFFQAYVNDKGSVRNSNQDSLAILKAKTVSGQAAFAVVCDGMGGGKGGETASKYCVEKFVKWFWSDAGCILNSDEKASLLKEAWQELAEDINDRLVLYGQEQGSDPGTTLTAALLYEDQYYVIQVGDSRAYLLGSGVQQITVDQSVVEQRVRAGEITAAEAAASRDRNILTECVGITWSIHPEFYCGQIHAGETMLLCTDGFWHNIEDEELDLTLSSEGNCLPGQLQAALEKLLRMDRARGEEDNVTAAVLLVQSEVDEQSNEEKIGEAECFEEELHDIPGWGTRETDDFALDIFYGVVKTHSSVEIDTEEEEI